MYAGTVTCPGPKPPQHAAESAAVCYASPTRAGLARAPQEDRMRKWQCIVCGWIYDEAEGFDEDGIPPGTPWEEIPEDFICPECGVGKEDFEMIEIG